MGSKSRQLHIFFFPLMAHGHLIPTMDMAKLFAERGVKATIVTTPRNVPIFSKTRGTNVDIQIIKFPAVEAGLPEGCENVDSVTSEDMSDKFIKATKMLQQPLEQLLEEYQPSCLVADMFFPWATDVAANLGIPRLAFSVTSFFSLSSQHSLQLYEPHKKVFSDSEPFVIPSFPGEIKLTRMELPDFYLQEVETDFYKLLKEAIESEFTSYGVVVNSFYELEPAYADHYRKVLGIKAWHIGPVSLCSKDAEDKAQRGKEASIDEHECLKWLSTKKLNSVIYICLGSMPNFSDSQLLELAMGIEASEQQFIWVREAIERAMTQILVGEEAARAKALGEMARRAVEEGGSSYSDLNALIEELRLYCL
ncbi:scopoletin glucosyltransferase [Quercus suber]|uniref:Scopoletin glucosyltransferase n=1 Tax=Quercus suber TaxID=58331 RepID=A0AAW0L7C0_QUESU